MISSISLLMTAFCISRGIKCLGKLVSEGVNGGEFWEGLGMDTDLGFGFLPFRGTWRVGLL